MSIEVEHESDTAQQLREAFYDMRQPAAATLALATECLTWPGKGDAKRAGWTGVVRSPSRVASPGRLERA